MKSIIYFNRVLLLTLMLVINSLVVISQTPPAEVVVKGRDIYKIKQSYDGGFISISFISNTYVVMLLKHDVNGRVLWEKNLGDIVIRDFVELEDGSIILVGRDSDYFSPVNGTAVYFKLSSCGDFIWGKKINRVDTSLCEEAYTITDVKDGLIITTRRDLLMGLTTYLDCFKVDYNGYIIWNKSFLPNVGMHGYSLMTSSVDDFGNIIFAGSCAVKDPWDEDVDAALICPYFGSLDVNGDLLWEIAGGEDFPICGINWGFAPIVDKDGMIYCTVQEACEILDDGWRPVHCMITVDPKSQNIEFHSYPIADMSLEYAQNSSGLVWTDDSRENMAMDLFYFDEKFNGGKSKSNTWTPKYVDSNNLYHPAGNRNELINNTKSFNYEDVTEYAMKKIAIVDKEGNIIKDRRLNDNEPWVAMGNIFRMQNGDFLWSTVNYRDISTYIYRLGSNLEDVEFDLGDYDYNPYCDKEIKSGKVNLVFELVKAPVGVSEVNTEKAIRLYPNPVNDGMLKIYLQSGIGSKTVDFYDATGRLCRTVNISEGWAQQSVDISDLSKGLYIVKLTVNNRIVDSEKLIIK